MNLIETLNNVLTAAYDLGYDIDTTMTVDELIIDAKEFIEVNADEEDVIQIDVTLDGKKNNFVEVMPDGVELNVTGDFFGAYPKEGRQCIHIYVGDDAKVYHIYTNL